MKHEPEKKKLKEEDIVVIKTVEENRGKWKIGIVPQLFKGQDDVKTSSPSCRKELLRATHSVLIPTGIGRRCKSSKKQQKYR